MPWCHSSARRLFLVANVPIRDRVVADFTNLDADPDKFNLSLQKLIAALRKDM